MKIQLVVTSNKKVRSISLIVLSILLVVLILRLFYHPMINVSNSMSQRFWITKIGDRKIIRGDFVVIRFHDYRMKNPGDFELVVKEVVGITGDMIKVQKSSNNKISQEFLLPNNITVPVFKILSNNKFTPLSTHNITIPKGYYFLKGNNNPSFDSRYKEFGLIAESHIYGKTFPIF